jgi:D-alanyl-D-alanine carboxypeptidase
MVAGRVLAAVVLVGALGLAGCTPPPNAPALQADVNALVGDGVPGAVSYTHQGDLLALPVAGVRDLGTRETIRNTDRFRVGSITKSFVSVVLLQLESEGRLSLDNSVERWLPGKVPGGAGITVRQLLNHTSGLFDYLNDDDNPNDATSPRQRVLQPYETNDDYVWSEEGLLAIAVSYPPHFAPGAGWRYSNTNYLLAGMIVRAVTGSGVDAEVTRRIINPLNLGGTSFPTTNRFITGDHSRGYLRDPQSPYGWWDVTELSPSIFWGAGGVVSTPADLAAFHRQLLAGGLLPPTQQAELLHTVPTGGNLAYGLGIFSLSTPCGTAWGHDGSVFGYNSVVLTTADGAHQVALAINTNIGPTDTVWANDLNRALADGLCGVATGQQVAPTPAIESARKSVSPAAAPAAQAQTARILAN